jgi:hypothetical protein
MDPQTRKLTQETAKKARLAGQPSPQRENLKSIGLRSNGKELTPEA